MRNAAQAVASAERTARPDRSQRVEAGGRIQPALAPAQSGHVPTTPHASSNTSTSSSPSPPSIPAHNHPNEFANQLNKPCAFHGPRGRCPEIAACCDAVTRP